MQFAASTRFVISTPFFMMTILMILVASPPQWMSISEWLQRSADTPKMSLLYIMTSDCVYCKKMEREVFTQAKVRQVLSTLYVIKFDAHSKDTLNVGEVWFYPDKNPDSIHPLAHALASEQGVFAAPTLLLLSEEMTVLEKNVGYMTGTDVLGWLNKHRPTK